MDFAATRIDSSSRSMSRSAESEAPTMFSCSRRCIRSSASPSSPTGRFRWVESRMLLTGAGSSGLLDADGADFLDVRDARQALLHAVLLQRAHVVLEALRQHVGDPRVLLDQLLQLVGGDQQLVQAAASLEAA